jgi:hypothetical protein
LLKELKKVYFETNRALDSLLEENNLKNPVDYRDNDDLEGMSLEQLRSKMARDHNAKVSKLVAGLGRKIAIQQGRKKLYEVGIRMGENARLELGVGDSISEVMKAAKILYRVLGIDFKINFLSKTEAVMFVNRCSLSKCYNDITCEVLSAADEGVVRGLSPSAIMKFQERITSGAANCKAQIRITGTRLC